MTLPADRLWAFSLRVYGKPGVAEACLELQDERGADVNLLLWCAWVGAGGIALEQAALAAAAEATAPWRENVVRPLRGVRRAMKADLGAVAASEAAELRARIKAAELSAERLQQEALAALPHPGRPAAPPSAIADNLRLYLEFLGVPGSVDLPHLVSASLETITAEGLGGAVDQA